MSKEEVKEETQKRLTEAQWIVVSSLWESGDFTLKDLAEKFGVSEPALSQGFKRRGIKRGSKAHLASKEIEAKIREEKQELVKDIYEFKKKFLRYGDFLMSLTMNEITDAKKKGDKLFSRKNEIETVIAATKVYRTIRNDMYHLYDLYNKDNAELDQNQEFNIGVYSESELEKLREAQELEESLDLGGEFTIRDFDLEIEEEDDTGEE